MGRIFFSFFIVLVLFFFFLFCFFVVLVVVFSFLFYRSLKVGTIHRSPPLSSHCIVFHHYHHRRYTTILVLASLSCLPAAPPPLMAQQLTRMLQYAYKQLSRPCLSCQDGEDNKLCTIRTGRLSLASKRAKACTPLKLV